MYLIVIRRFFLSVFSRSVNYSRYYGLCSIWRGWFNCVVAGITVTDGAEPLFLFVGH